MRTDKLTIQDLHLAIEDLPSPQPETVTVGNPISIYCVGPPSDGPASWPVVSDISA
ncbi:MAG: hypothetical protein KME26_20265 [Oscillatoria princeps RMCB-10]|nr:hypothetical protein [Oscillatoria princeps RMCB-10]